MGDISPVVASISTGIARRAAGYTSDPDNSGRTERQSLTSLDDQVEPVITRLEAAVAQRPPSRQRHGGLTFRHLYAVARNPVPDEEGWRVPSALPAALIAAEVEFRGPLRLVGPAAGPARGGVRTARWKAYRGRTACARCTGPSAAPRRCAG